MPEEGPGLLHCWHSSANALTRGAIDVVVTPEKDVEMLAKMIKEGLVGDLE